MNNDLLRYDKMVENALRGVVRTALRQVADHGLPGDHSIYVTFRTDGEGVAIPDRLRAEYPEEMTIVLEHQFWDLNVVEDYFEVTLSFNSVRERLHVPFTAVTAFADPSESFGLKFEAISQGEAKPQPEAEEPEETPEAAEGGAAAEKPKSEKVVALDSFRKK
jgi:hypothetical protein